MISYNVVGEDSDLKPIDKLRVEDLDHILQRPWQELTRRIPKRVQKKPGFDVHLCALLRSLLEYCEGRNDYLQRNFSKDFTVAENISFLLSFFGIKLFVDLHFGSADLSLVH